MKIRYPIVVLVLALLAFLLITGCTGPGVANRSSQNPATSPAIPSTTPVTPSPVPPVAAQTVTIDLVAQNMAFDQSAITVPAGARVIVNFRNREEAGSSQVTGIAHNFAVYDPPAGTTIFSGEIITGGENATYRFTAPDTPGIYVFRCDVHPALMTGKFIVV